MFPKGLARRLVLHSLPCHEYESAWIDIFKGIMRWIAQKICIKMIIFNPHYDPLSEIIHF